MGKPPEPDPGDEPIVRWSAAVEKMFHLLLRELQTTQEWLAEVAVLLDQLPAVRGAKTRSERPDTTHGALLRDAMRAEGIPEALIGKCMERYFVAARRCTSEAASKAKDRVLQTEPKPESDEPKRPRKDKK
jgi:hypothetical protein